MRFRKFTGPLWPASKILGARNGDMYQVPYGATIIVRPVSINFLLGASCSVRLNWCMWKEQTAVIVLKILGITVYNTVLSTVRPGWQHLCSPSY